AEGSGAGAGASAGSGAAFLAGAFLAAAFFADFFGAAFFADFLAFADFFADFLADFLADFFDFLAYFFFSASVLLLLAFLPFFFLPLAIVILLLSRVYRALSLIPHKPVDQIGSGRGPPVAQSRSSIVCTTGTDVPPAICTMHPILPAAIISGLTIAILAIFRSRNLLAMSGWRMLYVPAEPQHKWLSGTSFTTNPFLESNSFGAPVIFCPCCSEHAAC